MVPPGKKSGPISLTPNWEPCPTRQWHAANRGRVSHNSEPDAKIVLSSFRAVYGIFIKLDITEKIKAHAKLDDTGLFAEGVSLPTGKHNVTISIADNLGRVASRAVEFTVA